MDKDREFSDFASARWGPLVRSAVFLGCSVHEAQDLVQATLMRCYLSWSKVASASDRDAYVYRVLLNTHTDSRRRLWWGESATATVPEQAGADAAEAIAVADAIHRALSSLSRAHREVVVLRYFAQLSEQQTARALGLAPGTVKSRLSRALAQLATSAHLSDLSEGTTP